VSDAREPRTSSGGSRGRIAKRVLVAGLALTGVLVAALIARDGPATSVSGGLVVAPSSSVAPDAASRTSLEPVGTMDEASEQVASHSVIPRGEPARVLIAAIGVDSVLVRLGLRPDRSMQVPDFGLAGWYAVGPRPGDLGPAVLVAHVDSRAGPDVFFRLRDLVVGDQVLVEYDSGDDVTFIVTRTEQVPKDALPVESIWPLTNDRLLTLITCGGSFDRDVRSYRDNVIVYAAQLDPAGVDAAPEGSSGQR
jgi:hypothetical protein